MSDYIEVLDETDPGSILNGDTLIHTDKSMKADYIIKGSKSHGGNNKLHFGASAYY